MTHPIRLIGALVVAFALVAPTTPANAIVPPKNCGYIKVKGKRYQIKADQITCRYAKSAASTYLRTGRRPSGYRCERNRSGALAFRCTRGRKQIWAIRR